MRNKYWWGKRPLSGTGVSRNGMRFWKKLSHKIERQINKKTINYEKERL